MGCVHAVPRRRAVGRPTSRSRRLGISNPSHIRNVGPGTRPNYQALTSSLSLGDPLRSYGWPRPHYWVGYVMISYQLEQAFPEALGELAMRVDREGRKPLAIRSMG